MIVQIIDIKDTLESENDPVIPGDPYRLEPFETPTQCMQFISRDGLQWKQCYGRVERFKNASNFIYLFPWKPRRITLLPK